MATLAQIYTGLTGQSASGREVGREVTPWTLESQGVEPGGAFVALGQGNGARHAAIAEAVQRGALVVVAEGAEAEFTGIGAQIVNAASATGEPLQPPVLFVVENGRVAIQKLINGRRSHTSPLLQIIAILGKGGRTTVKEMVGVVLGQRFRTWQGPERASDLASLLTLLDMPLDSERAVIEMAGSDGEALTLMQPDVLVVIDAPAPLVEGIARGVASLPATAVVILNGDEPVGREMGQKRSGALFLYGLEPGLTLWADQIESHGLDGMTFRFQHGEESIFARVPILGRSSVQATLAAASVGLSQGQSWAEIMAGLKDLAEMEMLRLLVVEGVNGSTLLDDSYEARPESVLAALNLLNNLDGRKVAVLGDMHDLGEQEEKGHRLVAVRAAAVASLFVAVGQMAAMMVEEARDSGLPAPHTFAASNSEEAATWLRGQLQPGDIVLVKGAAALRLGDLVAELSGSGGTP